MNPNDTGGGQTPIVSQGSKRVGCWTLGLGGLVAFLVICGVIGALNSPSKPAAEKPAADKAAASGSAAAPSSSAAAASDAEAKAVPSAWTTTEEEDGLSGGKLHVTCTRSSNEVKLDWPYVDVYAELCVRKSPGEGTDAWVALRGKGQILCSYGGCPTKVKFGDKPVQTLTGREAADHSSNIVFLTPASRLIGGLRTADTTKVELRLYEAGDQTIEFPTNGFEWAEPPAKAKRKKG